jgi:hypothetical protein
MNKKIKKFFRRLLARCQRAYKKVINFVTGKKEPILLENTYQEPFALLYQDTYTPDPGRVHSEVQIYPGEIVQENLRKKSDREKQK